MTSSKRLASGLLRRGMSGSHGGLSWLGCLMGRAAEHVLFHRRELERSWHFNRPAPVPASGWTIPTDGKTVYDFGANCGSNIPYYRLQGFDVVAVEANPVLAERLEHRFKTDRGVKVINACLIANSAEDDVCFFVNRRMDKLSTFIQPTVDVSEFETIRVRGRTPASLVAEHGPPFYVKIDLEGADGLILDALRGSSISPPYISTEAHSVDVLAKLMLAGYEEFKIVEGRYVHCRYFELPAGNGHAAYQFEKGESAGPFGEDIPGAWVGADAIFDHLSRYGTGWKDIHARRVGTSAAVF